MTSAKPSLILRIISVLCFIFGAATLIPHAAATETGMLGYKALCPFSPVSTGLILYAGVTIHRYLGSIPK